jgi:hypothetical protein
MKEKVKFTNEQGMVFFECSATEARLAMRAVEDSRSGVDQWKKEGQRLRQEFDTLFKGLMPDVSKDMSYALDGLEATIVSEMFSVLEGKNMPVTHLFMNAVRYADLRKWDRDTLDIETEMYKLQAGWMASMWGAKVVIREAMPENDVVAVSAWKDRMDHKKEDVSVRWRFKFLGKPPVAEDDFSSRLDAIEVLLREIRTIKAK